MSSPKPPDFFNKEMSLAYDERNRRLAPISECMHFLIRLILRDFPAHSRVLCVGVGTGAEILSLAKAFPEWTFVGIDPSAPMLDVCRERLSAAGVINRCELVHGYVHDAPSGENFDIALSILVGHFVKREDKLSFYRGMCQRLRQGGCLINAEISIDLNSADFPSMLRCWEGVQSLMGANADSLQALPKQLREVLSILPPMEIEEVLTQSGVDSPVRFFQALMICAWFGTKKSSQS
jgi:tRNA (cmo5U34)-methyltransferase